MKKLLIVLSAFITMAMASCNSTVDPIAPTENNDLPAATGTLGVTYTDDALNITPEVTAASGDNVTVSLLIKKSADGGKPNTVYVYAANQANYRGKTDTPLFTTKLKNIDEQTKTFEYTVSPTSGVVYLHFDVYDNNSKITRKTLKINIGSVEQIKAVSGVTLGGQLNAAASRLASATGDLYKVCDLDSNINFVDITYAATRSGDFPQFLSNKERLNQGYSTTIPTSNVDCGGKSTAGGNDTYFQEAPSSVNFDAITDNAGLQALSITSMSQSVVLNTGKTYIYTRGSGTQQKKGLIRVTNITKGGNTYAGGTVVFDYKVQK